MVKLGELRRCATELFAKNGVEEARADADFLLSYLAEADMGELILGDKKIDFETERKIRAALERRIAGEPVQYITGRCEFFGCEFKVNSSTLIPRADTEILVEKAAELIEKNRLKTLLDIGAGSGCIGISLLLQCKVLRASLLDFSENALKTAVENAKSLGVYERAEFLHEDILKADEDKIGHYDIIVSNPPYIESETVKTLDEKVKNYEPLSALDGGADGLLFYKSITALAAKCGGFLAFEIGYNQAESVYGIMSEYFENIKEYKDYGGNSRVLVGKNKQI